MQHVSTYNSHLQAKLRTVIPLQGGCAHLGSHVAHKQSDPQYPHKILNQLTSTNS